MALTVASGRAALGPERPEGVEVGAHLAGLPPQRVGGHVVHPEIPVQMKDRLAETGRALEPVVAELAAWAERQGDPAPVASVRS